jgi:hypothetical protein
MAAVARCTWNEMVEESLWCLKGKESHEAVFLNLIVKYICIHTSMNQYIPFIEKSLLHTYLYTQVCTGMYWNVLVRIAMKYG